MNIKEYFEEPKIEIVVFDTEDIITTSSNIECRCDIEMEEIDDW